MQRPTLEITTMIGCPLMCNFCPQDNLRDAYGKEAEKYMSLDTFKTVVDKLPKNCRIVQNKWVFKIKCCCKFHARLCALGYMQVGGEDFTDNFAPMIKEETFQIILTLAELKK